MHGNEAKLASSSEWSNITNEEINAHKSFWHG